MHFQSVYQTINPITTQTLVLGSKASFVRLSVFFSSSSVAKKKKKESLVFWEHCDDPPPPPGGWAETSGGRDWGGAAWGSSLHPPDCAKRVLGVFLSFTSLCVLTICSIS